MPTSDSARRSRPASSTCCGSRASGRRRCASSTRASGSSRSRTCGRPPRPARSAGSRASPPAPSSGSSRASSSSSRGRGASCSTGPRRPPTTSSRMLDGTRGVGRIVQAGSLRRRKETIGDLDLLVETDDPDGVVARFTGLGAGRPGHRRRAREGRRQADARAERRPDDHAAGRGRDLPRPLHRLGRPQHPPPRHRARPRLEPVREGLPTDRRGGPAARGRRRRPAHVPGRGRGLCVPRPRVHRARAARGPGRGRGRPRGPAADADHARATCGATCTRTPSGATASTRSRSWPRRAAGSATPTRC